MTHAFLTDFGVLDEDVDLPLDEPDDIVLRPGPNPWDPCPVRGCDAIRDTPRHVAGGEGCPVRGAWAA